MGVKASLILITSLLAPACSSRLAGSGDGSPPPDADPMTARGFCRGYLEVVAELFSLCDGVSLEDARGLIAGEPPCDRFVADIAAGRVSFDGTHGASCLAALRTVTCAASSSMSASIGQATDCQGLTTPLVPAGGACTSFYLIGIAEQCQNGAYCREGTPYACTGACTARAPLGASCDNGTADIRCVQTATCDSASKKCVMSPPSRAEGEPCGDAGQGSCQRPLFCDTTAADGGASPGVCRAQKASGPCATNSQCVDTERCVGIASTAKVCALPKKVGDACTPGARECGLFDHCSPAGTCTHARAAIGEACGFIVADEATPCVVGAYCDGPLFGSGTCRASKHAGDACTADPLTQCDGNNAHCDATTHLCVACAP
jgi:hypothetical protein